MFLLDLDGVCDEPPRRRFLCAPSVATGQGHPYVDASAPKTETSEMRKSRDPNEAMDALLENVDRAYEDLVLSHLSADRVVQVLSSGLSPRRRARIEKVLTGRSRAVATVLEGVLNTGNVSAVMRTAEAFGFLNFHVVTGDQPYKHSDRTSTGAEKWLDVQVWETPASCISKLREDGYRIVVTHLDDRATPLEDVDFTQRTALVLGNELDGVSAEMLALADASCYLPMAGFVQSFNVSVAAGIALHAAWSQRARRLGVGGDLDAQELARLRARYYMRANAHARELLRGMHDTTVPDAGNAGTRRTSS
jgi:tRNA (guanosine-2'-O-)-methyltransferase